MTPDGILQSQRARQRRFLACYAACGSLTRAARWSKIHRQTHYDWMKNIPEYPGEFATAEKLAARTLQDEAVRRAHEGVKKAVYYKGKVVGYETEFSDTLMITMLKATDPEKFRDRSDNRHSGADGSKLPDFNDFVAAFAKERAKEG